MFSVVWHFLFFAVFSVDVWEVRRPVAGVLGEVYYLIILYYVIDSILSHSCLMQDSSCSTVLGLCCQIFPFIMRQMFPIGERSAPEGPKIMCIQFWPLVHRPFTWFSESFDDIMNCGWRDLLSQSNFTFRNIFLKLSYNFWHSLSQIGEPPPIFTSERLSLKCSIYTQSCYWPVANWPN